MRTETLWGSCWVEIAQQDSGCSQQIVQQTQLVGAATKNKSSSNLQYVFSCDVSEIVWKSKKSVGTMWGVKKWKKICLLEKNPCAQAKASIPWVLRSIPGRYPQKPSSVYIGAVGPQLDKSPPGFSETCCCPLDWGIAALHQIPVHITKVMYLLGTYVAWCYSQRSH